MSSRKIDTGYEPFSQEPEYIELNKRFIRTLIPYLDSCRRVLDLACGTGTLSELLLAELRTTHAPTVRDNEEVVPLMVLGVDISRDSLKLAQLHFRALHSQVISGFIETSADSPPVKDTAVDLVLMGNAIHCFPDKHVLLQHVGRVLRPGGSFAFNSSFYSGTIVPGTEEFYHQWLKASLEYIRRRDTARRQRGLTGIARTRGCGNPAFSNRWLSPREYTSLLERHGFEVKSVNECVYEMSCQNFERVGAYAGLASVLLSGYPTPVACEALQQAARPAFAKVKATLIPRSSLEIIAVRA